MQKRKQRKNRIKNALIELANIIGKGKLSDEQREHLEAFWEIIDDR